MTFPDKQKLRDLITSRPTIQEILKEVLQAENYTVVPFLTGQIGQTSQALQHIVLVRLSGNKCSHILLMGIKKKIHPL